jgi:Na+-driven multidrug efflux pump
VNSVIAAANVVCNIALNVVLIPRYGIDGAAWASTVSYSLLFLATAAVYRRVTHVPLRALIVPAREDWARYLRLCKRVVGQPVDEPRAATNEAAVSEEESAATDATPPG